LKGFVTVVQQFDVDMIVGYEVQHASIGYLIERASVLSTLSIHFHPFE
jgi:DNA polymerase elongation subunit (family B)